MRKLILTTAWIGCLFCVFKALFAANAPTDLEKKRQDSLRAVRAEKLEVFRQSHPGLTTSIDEVTGAPYQLYGDLSAGITSSDPAEATYEFFEKNKELYGINDPRIELKIASVKKHSPKQGGGTLVQLEQSYRGVKVSRGHFKVVFNAAGKLSGITGVFSPIIELSATPSIDSLSAIGIARRDINYTPEEEKLAVEKWGDIPTPKGIKKGKPPVNASLLIVPFKREYRLVWIIGLAKADSPGIWELWIDAHSGTILQKKEDANIIRQPSRNQPAPADQDSASVPPRPKEDAPERFKKSSVTPQLIFFKKDSTFVSPSVTVRPDVASSKKGGIPSDDSGRGNSIMQNTPPVPLRGNEAESLRNKLKHGGMKSDSLGQVTERGQIRFNTNLDSLMREQVIKRMKGRKPKSSPRSSLAPSGATLVTIMSENFEGSFPEGSPDWQASDKDIPPDLYGEYFWDDDSFLPYEGSRSGWCAGGGADRFPGLYNYVNNMNSWMVYGPFSLSDATTATLHFAYWLKSEKYWDWLYFYVSTDGSNFSGRQSSGNSGGWWTYNFGLDTLGPTLIGRSGCWIAFGFTSDGSTTDKGAFVDEIVLSKTVPSGGTPDLVCYKPSGWSNNIVVSRIRGTNSQSPPAAGDTAFIDWAVANTGTRATSTRTLSVLFVDDNPIAGWHLPLPLEPNTYAFVEDYPIVFTSPGQHRISLEHDFEFTEDELDDLNNYCDWDFLIGATCPIGEAVGTGFGVFGNYLGHIDCYCNGTSYSLDDFTRQFNNNIHGHFGEMQDFASISTLRYDPGGQPDPITDTDTSWDAPNQKAAIDAQVYAAKTYQYLLDTFGRNGFDGAGEDMWSVIDVTTLTGIESVAGYDTLRNRVYYAPPPGGGYSAAASIDVVAHEWGHGIVDFTSHLNLTKEPGALNESFGDMFGVTLSAVNGDPDYWPIGEDIPQAFVSNLANPEFSSSPQPHTYRSTNWFWVNPGNCSNPSLEDNCGVHNNSGVPNKMFYLFAAFGAKTHNDITVNGIGIGNAFNVMLTATDDFWDSTTNFLQARIGSIAAASQIDPSWADILKKAWDAVRVCLKGDFNDDGTLTAADVILLLNCVFLVALCNLCARDMNCDEQATAADVVIVVNAAFLGTADHCPNP